MKTKPSRLDRIMGAVHALNIVHGVGQVRRIRQSMFGCGEFWQEPFGMRPRKRRFRTFHHADGRITVFALRHQLTVAP